ncbi:CBS domain-containing protein [Actinosynnema sp. NPDC059335]|uniref:CBS domain-containing protein n=1 Tax=Actinosynnema sp. NPDC059335 TaxID=3346804 RepID=UPI00366C1740
MRDPTVASLMTREIVTAEPDTPFKHLARLLTGHGISAVPIVDADGRPVGVVSEADLLTKQEHPHDARRSWLSGPGAGHRRRKAEGTTAADVMTSRVVTTTTGTPISTAAHELRSAGVRRLFVVDQDGRLVGVLARRDALKAFTIDDEVLREEILRTVFERVLWLEPIGVDVRVEHGVVTLRGMLDRRSDVVTAERVTRVMPGVVDVRSELTYAWDDRRVRTGRRARSR